MAKPTGALLSLAEAPFVPTIVSQGSTKLATMTPLRLLNMATAFAELKGASTEFVECVATVIAHTTNGVWILELGQGSPEEGVPLLTKWLDAHPEHADGGVILPKSWDTKL